MSQSPPVLSETDRQLWVPETRFGKWFLRTSIWYEYVLQDAFGDLRRLVGDRCPEQSHLLDLGCGPGLSLPLLDELFSPRAITAVDIDPEVLDQARQAGAQCQCEVTVEQGTARKLQVPDNTFDLVSCHQLIHHVSFREEVMQEILRVLKPGGMLLLSESCRPFLKVYWVRWLFRHPKMVQKTAAGYIDLVREAGFSLTENDILETAPWWSRRDLGLLEKVGLQFWTPQTAEVAIVATKPG